MLCPIVMLSLYIFIFKMLDFTKFAEDSGLIPANEVPMNVNKWHVHQLSDQESSLFTDVNEDVPREAQSNRKSIQIPKEGRKTQQTISAAGHIRKHNKCSCFVRLSEGGFGEIQYFLKPTDPHNEPERIFAVVNVYPPPQIEPEINVYYCRRATRKTQLINANDLGEPLYVVFRDGYIYFLSAIVQENPQWLQGHMDETGDL